MVRVRIAVCCLLLSGCAARKPQAKYIIVIPKECVTSDIELQGCKDGAATTDCLHSRFSHVKGCEQIKLVK